MKRRLWTFFWRWRSRSFRRHPVGPQILLYHRVVPDRPDPLLLNVSPENFAAQVAYLQQRRTVLPLAVFAARWADGTLPANAVALTFDDGFADNLTVAEPILRELGAHATIFVTSRWIQNQQEAWWDALEAHLLAPPRLPSRLALRVGGEECVFAVEPDEPCSPEWHVQLPAVTGPQRAFNALSARLSRLDREGQDAALAALAAWSGQPLHARPWRRFMTVEELRRAEASPHLLLGAHTASHLRLSGLSAAGQQEEMERGASDLAAWLGRRPDLIAYPFGTYNEIDPRTGPAAAAAGFSFGFANMPAQLTRRSRRWELPRVLVRNWTAAEMATQLGL